MQLWAAYLLLVLVVYVAMWFHKPVLIQAARYRYRGTHRKVEPNPLTPLADIAVPSDTWQGKPTSGLEAVGLADDSPTSPLPAYGPVSGRTLLAAHGLSAMRKTGSWFIRPQSRHGQRKPVNSNQPERV